SGAGSQWVSSGQLYVGDIGNGQLLVSDGGVVTAANAIIGHLSTGEVRVTGDGSTFEAVGSPILVGLDGSGGLTIADGGLVRTDGGSGVVHVGANAGSSGILNIGAAADDAAAAAGVLGAAEVRFGAGTGSLVFNHTDTDYEFDALITGGGTLDHYAGTTILTADNSYTGDTNVHGGTLVVEGASEQGSAIYWIGQDAGDNGAVIVRDGGSIVSGMVYLGLESGATGAVEITGPGSTWDMEVAYVGHRGSGEMTIAAGGVLNSSYGHVGRDSGSNGVVTVTGAGSAWNLTNQLGVGNFGDGALTVADGGAVNITEWMSVGVSTGSSGRLAVTGAGSVLAVDAATVGNQGAGELISADGGLVDVSSGTGLVRAGHTAIGTGSLTIGAGVGDAAVGAGTLEAAEVGFGSGTGSRKFNHTNTGYAFDALITGGGTVNHYAGTTTLTADNSWSGGTAVHGGTLVIAGDSSAVTGTAAISG